MNMINRTLCLTSLLTILSIGFIISAILLICFSNLIIKRAIHKEFQLKEGTSFYDLWRNPPVPIYTSVYVFDLINEEDFLNGAKPHVVQRGPFVYKEEREKVDIKSYSNGTISYRVLRNYTFDRSKSIADETFNITTINIVYMTLINYLQTKDLFGIVRKLVGTILSTRSKLTMQITVKEYFWGYRDSLLNLLKNILSNLITDDRISFFDIFVNPLQYETYLVNDGVDDNNKLGQIERFNFSTNLSIWSNSYANMINGTDGTFWHPDVKQDQLFYVFTTEMCRSNHLQFNQSHQNIYKIETYQYKLSQDVYANSTDNQGFCSEDDDHKQEIQCLPNGLFSLAPCLQFITGNLVPLPLPIIGSNPHFLDGDPSLLNAIDGLAPDDSRHRSFADIEPITGIIINGSGMMQINIDVVNDPSISAIADIQPLVYPLLWIDQHGEIDQLNADIFKGKMTISFAIVAIIQYGFLIMGIILFLFVIYLIATQKRTIIPTDMTALITLGDETIIEDNSTMKV